MQIQCPKCNEWTDSECDKCTVCGFSLHEEDLQKANQNKPVDEPKFRNDHFDLGLGLPRHGRMQLSDITTDKKKQIIIIAVACIIGWSVIIIQFFL